MKIVKKHTNNFSILDNRVAQATSLSLKAKGLYFYIFSLPDDWDFSVKRIAAVTNEPETRITAALNELITAGLVVRSFEYGEGIYGRRAVYTIYDYDTRPALQEATSMEKPTVEKPNIEKPTIEKPTIEKPTIEKPTIEKPSIGFLGDYISNNINKEINKNKEPNNTNATAQNAPAQIAKTPAPKKEPSYHLYGEYKNVRLSDDDYKKLQTEFTADYNVRIDNLSAYIASTGKTYKNHLATIRNWARMEKQRNTQKQQERNAGFYGINENDNNAEWEALWDKADKATAANNDPYPINDFNPYQ